MKYLYILKHKGYKLYPQNLQLLTRFPYKDFYNCVLAFWSYKEVKKARDYYINNYHLELDIVKFKLDDRRKK